MNRCAGLRHTPDETDGYCANNSDSEFMVSYSSPTVSGRPGRRPPEQRSKRFGICPTMSVNGTSTYASGHTGSKPFADAGSLAFLITTTTCRSSP